MSQNPNDFFHSFEGNSSSNGIQQRKPKPPPPPRRPTATTSSAVPSASYYGGTSSAAAATARSSVASSVNQSVRQPPSKPQTASSTTTTTTREQRPAATSSSPYYNAASTFTQPSANVSNSYPSNTKTPTPSYEGNTMYPSTRNTATAAATPAYHSAPYNTTTAPAPASNDWYTDYSTANNTTTDAVSSNPYMNPYNSASLSGSMETTEPTAPNAPPSYFTPTMNMTAATSSSSFGEDMENEPPLLEELGINLQQIFMKTKAVVIPFRRFAGNTALMDPSLIVEDADLAGPLVFALALGFELLLGLEVEFGAIYGFGLAGCVSMTLILNLMVPTQAVSFWTVTSILGYALLPVNILAALKILLQNLAGFQTLVRFLAVLTIVWSTTASTRLLEVGCGMAHQRYLIAYPIALLYTAFVLITIF